MTEIGFNSAFVFDTGDNESAPEVALTVETSFPSQRLVDTLIAKFRKERETEIEIDPDQSIPKFQEDDNTAHLTDIVRSKKTRKKKTKVDTDKYMFTRAVDKYCEVSSFIDLRLSKPLLKALTEMSLHKPMPIQCACIPVAVLNHDICACARTGSGKTLAFLLPVLERMTKIPFTTARTVTRALIISPTRELAVQIFQVAEKLVKYCPKIRVQLAAGGLDLQSQEVSLRQNPDLVIATPGRLIDHLSNAPSFNLQHIEYLVLDEADKLLDEYFVEQIGEIVKHCGKQRQTLLFSATMTESVKELATLSLKDPVQVFLNQATAVAKRLHQEFIRIRPHREGDRMAILTALLARTFNKRTIVFLQTKKECHRMHILLSLLGLSCAELHGDMTQAQRLEGLRRFAEATVETQSASSTVVDASNQSGKRLVVDILLATDLAARGLDIPNVQTVINYSLPQTMKQYIHRVGRTARATNVGRAVSLVAESDRNILKQIMKEAPFPIQARVIAPEVISRFQEKLTKLNPIVEEILQAEAEERELRTAQILLDKTEKLAAEGPDLQTQNGRRRIDWFVERKRQQRKEARSAAKKKPPAKKRKRNSGGRE